MKRTLLEAFAIIAIGAMAALAANALSPRGLRLTRDYFPAPTPRMAAPGSNAPADSLAALTARLARHGLKLADTNRVLQAQNDPRRATGQVLIIDARDDQHYQAGHLPGAVQFDYYRPEAFLPQLIPTLQLAREIIIYCNGGDCEDSELAAVMLREFAPNARDAVYVYAGGYAEWSSHGYPLEKGAAK